MQRVVHHVRVEVAGAARCDLNGWHTFRPDAPGIVLGFEIAFDDRDAKAVADGIDGSLQQAGLARSRRRHQIDGEDTVTIKMLAIVRCFMIVLAEDSGQYFDGSLADGLCRYGAGVIGNVNTFQRGRASALLAHGVLACSLQSGSSHRARIAG